MLYKRRCARDGSGGTCRKESDGRRLRVSRRPSYSGRAIAQPWRQAALILWVMHFAIVRLFYFMICYSGAVLTVAWFRVQVGHTWQRTSNISYISNIVQSDTVRLRRLYLRPIILIHFFRRVYLSPRRVKHDEGEVTQFLISRRKV